MTNYEIVLAACKRLQAVTKKEKHCKRNMIEFYRENERKINELPLSHIGSYSFENELKEKVEECTKQFKD